MVLLRLGPQWDPGRRLEEQSGWDAHVAFMDGLVDAGSLPTASAAELGVILLG